MPESVAHRFFSHLIAGLRYLHGQGIAHRDIKPENLLLGLEDVLKISDFGLATVFRHKGRERVLDRRCGTLPYVAPEVLRGPYRGDDVDLWSSGVVLTAMLTGELPWDSASTQTREYMLWEEERARVISCEVPRQRAEFGLWKRLPIGALGESTGSLAFFAFFPE
jgi:serine/threonine-protein kinase Chk1